MFFLNFISSIFFKKKKNLNTFCSKEYKYKNFTSFRGLKSITRSFYFQKVFFKEIHKFYYFILQILKPDVVIAENLIKNKQKKAYITKNGLKYIVFSEGFDEHPEWGNIIKINYVIYLLTGEILQKLDSSYERYKPFIYRHGNGQIITGIEETVHSMKLGEKRRIIIPDNLGYISTFLGPIPPFDFTRKKLFKKNLTEYFNKNVQLIMDIELVNISKDIQ